jgi:hypothetical protein
MTPDRIKISVSHMIYIDREPSWVKYEMASDVDANETNEQATQRISAQVNQYVIDVITETVAKIEEVNTKIKENSNG